MVLKTTLKACLKVLFQLQFYVYVIKLIVVKVLSIFYKNAIISEMIF